MTNQTGPTTPMHAEQVTITIDGRRFTVDGRHHLARDLLALAGLPDAGYDLTRVGKHGKVETFRDAQKVNVKGGDVFVSVNQQGTVA
ncbi:multiubiquitin domain-containing protein [Nocardia brasiliensis]|uniref:multiubiquitin domain-containing protein n=1 Tax=Nocardia brasiliensis TaxID=37326 RepID=UPI002454C667|nr:multiubiquitin domain-containing protein [Nocardia brasiliensis]